ncbi:MAG: hypothetical protein ACXV5D_02800, partial [Halobacteriota archaeon]
MSRTHRAGGLGRRPPRYQKATSGLNDKDHLTIVQRYEEACTRLELVLSKPAKEWKENPLPLGG